MSFVLRKYSISLALFCQLRKGANENAKCIHHNLFRFCSSQSIYFKLAAKKDFIEHIKNANFTR